MDDTIFELELTGMTHGGSALGRYNGRAIFVPYAIPGETITARITQDKGRFAFAQGVTLVEQSDARVMPECPHFGPGRCGGCQWQHIAYQAQLDFKQDVVFDQMSRLGGFKDVTVHPTIGSPDPWQYRSHITLHVAKDGRLGFISTDDQTVLPIEECHIIRPELLDMLDSVHLEEIPNLEKVRLQVGTDGDERLITISTSDNEIPEIEMDIPASLSYMSGEDRPQTLIGTGKVHYTIAGRTFQVTAGSFFQVNLKQAETLVKLVMERLNLQGTENILDLYSGVGLFTAFIAEHAALVTALESYPTAVADADANLTEFDNVDLIEGAVEDVLGDLEDSYDAVVVDPPRTGLEPHALDGLAEIGAAKIVYVSCDPATLGRDAKRLGLKGYRLVDVQPVDMFPQTYHIEAVATFERQV